MLGRCDKKHLKKTVRKSNPKSKICLTIRNHTQKCEKPMLMNACQVLKRKYIQKQRKSDHLAEIRRLVENRNKATSELRHLISIKEYMRGFSNSTAIISQYSSIEQQRKLYEYPHIVADMRINRVLNSYYKSRQYLFCFRYQCQNGQRGTKNNPTPILSTDCDDSEACLKTLLNKIQYMIKTQKPQHNKIQNALGEAKQSRFFRDGQMSAIFGTSHCKISEITHEKVEFQMSDEYVERVGMKKDAKKEQTRSQSANNKISSGTVPDKCLKPKVDNEYGFRNPPPRRQILARNSKRSGKNGSHSNRKFSRSCVTSEDSKRSSCVKKVNKTKNTQKKKNGIKTRKKEEYCLQCSSNKKQTHSKRDTKVSHIITRK